jgi:hypothetical protein
VSVWPPNTKLVIAETGIPVDVINVVCEAGLTITTPSEGDREIDSPS